VNDMLKKMILAGTAPLALAACVTAPPPPPQAGLAKLPKIAEVDERYLSYNVEMVEVTGGRFWAPYGGPPSEIYRMRPPTNLADTRLRAMAKHLGPAYVRISGTWANSTYLPAEGETVAAPPLGFNQVLTRDQWRGTVAFAKAVDAQIVTSFAGSPGSRNADRSWNPAQAQRLLDLTREAGGDIHGAELFNEPTIPPHGAFPKGYGVADFARDFRIFKAWAAKAAPAMKLTGPGGTAEGTMMKHTPQSEAMGFLQSGDLMAANPGSLDIVSYHFYGNVSQRCGSPASLKDQALHADWLDRTLIDAAFYGALRDRHEPGKPLWLNETAQTACGGSPWASTFLDSFRYINQLGALAQKGVAVVMHNTLAASDYGMIDQDTLAPRPNYWAAVLWKRIMGKTVLASPASASSDLRIYAHCLPAGKGSVGLVAINTGTAAQTVATGRKANAWIMTGQPLGTHDVQVNGNTPSFDAKGKLTGLDGVSANGSISAPAQAITFVAVTAAGNPACH
jgi:heparanase 1